MPENATAPAAHVALSAVGLTGKESDMSDFMLLIVSAFVGYGAVSVIALNVERSLRLRKERRIARRWQTAWGYRG